MKPGALSRIGRTYTFGVSKTQSRRSRAVGEKPRKTRVPRGVVVTTGRVDGASFRTTGRGETNATRCADRNRKTRRASSGARKRGVKRRENEISFDPRDPGRRVAGSSRVLPSSASRVCFYIGRRGRFFVRFFFFSFYDYSLIGKLLRYSDYLTSTNLRSY